MIKSVKYDVKVTLKSGKEYVVKDVLELDWYGYARGLWDSKGFLLIQHLIINVSEIEIIERLEVE